MSSLKFRTPIDDITSTSNAVWWIKKPSRTWTRRQLKQSVGTSFCNDLADLFRNISLHGYNKLLVPELCLWEKLIWLVVHSMTLFALITILSLTWEQFVAQYIVIHLHDPLYPVEKVPFPAVSICSNNRISRQVARLYANELRDKDPLNRSVEYFMERIHHFSNMYYKYNPVDDYEGYSSFQKFLDAYDTTYNETWYDTRKMMRRLTPNCNDYLVQCFLAGVEIECFNEKAFQESLTMYGQCCTFNLENTLRTRSYHNRLVNWDFGLTVILNTSREDDFAPILSLDGYIVIIHDPRDFADISSGGALEVFPTQGEESYLSIRAHIVDTIEALRDFSPETRKCYFDDEAPSPELLVRNSYSFTNCITRCRSRSIIALCRCLPFYMPLDLVDDTDGVVYCTLEHVSCLLRYNFKWHNVLTQRETLPGLERAIEEALFCPQCMPSCDDIQYQASLMTLPMDRYRASISMDPRYKKGLENQDISVLRVYFGETSAKYYRRVVGNTWFEAFSTIGNVSSIFIGCSIVAIFEILFFVVKYFVISIQKFVYYNTKHTKDDRNSNMGPSKLIIYP